jgi:hypothetical protein
MNGFLFNVLSRSRGTADVIRPRLTSLFERPGSNWPGAEWEGIMEELDEAPPPVGVATPSESLDKLEPAKAVHGTDPDEWEAPLSAETSPPAEPVRAGMPELRSPEAQRSNDRPQTASAAPAPDAPMADRPAPVAGFHEASQKTHAPIPPVSQPRTLKHVSPAERSARAPQLRDSTGVREETPAHGVSGVRDQPPLTPPAQRPRFQPMPSAQRPAASEPAVHVTIGRIEVRAVIEPGPQRKERAAPPVMSLNDYLKARARGGNG